MKETLRAWFIDPPPGVCLTESERVRYPAASLAMWNGITAFLAFAPVFALFGHAQVVVVNVAIAASFGLGLLAMWRGYFQQALIWGCFIVAAHGWVLTLLFGWGPGFHYQILLSVMVMALVVPGSIGFRAMGSTLFATSYVALNLAGTVWEPTLHLTAEQTRAFSVSTVSTVCLVLVLVSLHFTTTVEQAREARDEAAGALRGALDETRAIVNTMADGLVALDGSGVVRTRNHALDRLLRGTQLPQAVVDTAREAMETNQTTHGEFDLSDERIGFAVASPLAEGGAVVIVRDVTTEREVDRMKSEFTAVVSHELRTPLTSVLGFTRIIQGRLEKKILPKLEPIEDRATKRAVNQVRTNIDIILEEGRRLSNLINDVLDLAKLEAGSMELAQEAVDVNDLVRRALAATSGLFVDRTVVQTSEAFDDLPIITGDRDRLTQVLVNLISNARKFTEAGEIRLTARPHDDGVELRVIDTGAGIPATELEAIFDRFHQVRGGKRPQGTGLGLPICRHLVESHGGTIHAESEVGVGTQIVVRLPGQGHVLESG